MLKNKILPTVVLTSICIVVALLLALANILTTPRIEHAQKEKVAKTLREVYPEGESFEAVATEGRSLPESIAEVYSANDGGFVFKAEVKGYKNGLVIMVGVSPDGRITDTKYIESNETNGAEKTLNGAYNGKSAEDIETVIITGSTKTSNAYKQAVSDSLSAYDTLKGDSGK